MGKISYIFWVLAVCAGSAYTSGLSLVGLCVFKVLFKESTINFKLFFFKAR